MSDATVGHAGEGGGRRGTRRKLLAGVLAAILFGVGGFAASYSGLVTLPVDPPAQTAELPVTFVPVGALVASIGPEARHLRFAAELEVAPEEAAEVARLMPRVRDVLNGYLRAVEPAVLARPEALTILRAQMLRRVQMILGGAAVRDLLVTEFVFD